MKNMNFIVISDDGTNKGEIKIDGKWIKCALGKNGTIDASLKREGDGKTPIGKWPIRKVYYRADKIEKPVSPFETIAIEENFGWCDAAGDVNYNKFVTHPYPVSAEHLWRKDELYDICVVLGHNDNPIVDKMGSAIFLHIAHENYKPTEGCVAIKIEDLRKLLSIATTNSAIEILA